MKQIVSIGIGLIGGSLAKELKKLYPEATLFGIDNNARHMEQALKLGLIDAEATYTELAKADLVILSVPVDAAAKLLPEILDHIADHTLVLDMGSTKQNICQTVKTHKNRRNFLAVHPIAGTEFSGPKAATDNLFKNKTIIICEVENTAFKLQEKALQLFAQLGMRIRYMNPTAHDKHIAYVSHLSHISSFMLGKTVIEKEKNERDIFDMAGSGFESTVRLAKSSPDMWTPIFKENKQNVIETLEEYIQNLIAFKQLMQQDDFDGIYNEMKNTNHIKNILNGIS
ncbi:MAG TPA: prephenate dehydrogenase [Flavobacteriaceae bacterium]|nr:prephenate dehydrogenase [Flavobacteriaceae bacterium]